MDIIILLLQAFAAFHIGIAILFGIFLVAEKIWKESGAACVLGLFLLCPPLFIGGAMLMAFLLVRFFW